MVLDECLRDESVLILDGAIVTEISRLGGAMDGAAWCGVANKTHPEIVRRVHEAYLHAGCNIITANTFATCRHVLAGADLADEAPAITEAAVRLAREAVERVEPEQPVAVAGSMSNNLAWTPGTVSADPRFAPSLSEEAANYREMAEAMASAGADAILLEMMADVEHASLLAEAAASTGLPLWIGISASLLDSGEIIAWNAELEEPADRLAVDGPRWEQRPIEPVIDAMRSFDPQVMGIMHTAHPAMEPALAVLRAKWDGPVMAYPESLDAHAIAPEVFAASCLQWIREDGVRIVGGCCGTTIEHIRAMVDALEISA